MGMEVRYDSGYTEVTYGPVALDFPFVALGFDFV
jgi:hypothetical protein